MANPLRAASEAVASPRWGSVAVALAPLGASKAFRDFWMSNVFFFSGFWAQTIVLAWLAFALTHSEFAVAAFTAVRFAPQLLGPPGGALSDRFDRVKLLQVGNVISFASAAAIALLLAVGSAAYWQVMASGFVLGAMQAPLQPARLTLLMDVVPRDRVSSANALMSAAQMGTRVVAPAVAGALIASLGAGAALWFSAAWYVPAILMLLRVPEVVDRGLTASTGMLADIVDGFRVCVQQQEMAGVLIVSIAANVFAWPAIQSFLPVFADQQLHSGPQGLGFLFAANGVGSLLGSFAIAMLGDTRWKGALFLGGTAGFGLSLSAFALTDNMPLALALMLVGGALSACFGVMMTTLMMLLAPDEIRGRVMGVLMLSIGVLPFASLLQGAAAAVLGVSGTTFVSGVLLAVVMGAVALAIPGLRREG